MQNLALKPFLDSVVDITCQREEQALASSLTSSISRLLNVELALLCEIDRTLPETRNKIIAVSGPQANRQFSQSACGSKLAPAEVDAILEDCEERNERVFIDDGSSSLLAIPINTNHNATYYLCLKDNDWSEGKSFIIDGMVDVYRNFAQTIAESEHDGLTGLLNRKFFHERINNTILKARRLKLAAHDGCDRRLSNQSGSYWLCIFDIDHFKKINDKHGHIYGDEVLILIARMLKESFRSSDLLFRYGGEEFIIVVGPSTKQVATSLFEKFREKIQETAFSSIGQVTISMGVVEIDHSDIPTTIIGCADQALYHAKNTGRNKLAVYEELVESNLLHAAESCDDAMLF